jgi:hypothetical protein
VVFVAATVFGFPGMATPASAAVPCNTCDSPDSAGRAAQVTGERARTLAEEAFTSQKVAAVLAIARRLHSAVAACYDEAVVHELVGTFPGGKGVETRIAVSFPVIVQGEATATVTYLITDKVRTAVFQITAPDGKRAIYNDQGQAAGELVPAGSPGISMATTTGDCACCVKWCQWIVGGGICGLGCTAGCTAVCLGSPLCIGCCTGICFAVCYEGIAYQFCSNFCCGQSTCPCSCTCMCGCNPLTGKCLFCE